MHTHVSRPPPLAAWVAGGATVTLGLLAGTFALITGEELSRLKQQCSRLGCDVSTRDALWQGSTVETYESITSIALVGTAVGAITTLTILLLDAPSETVESQATRLEVTPIGARVSGSF